MRDNRPVSSRTIAVLLADDHRMVPQLLSGWSLGEAVSLELRGQLRARILEDMADTG
jgi:hypothetical protein